jgi:DNA-binding transcriptional ArsR family regulator
MDEAQRIDKAEVKKHWALLGLPRVEVRGWGGAKCWSKYVTSAEELVRVASEWTAEGLTVAVGINPRMTNIKHAGKDSDIAEVQNLVLDIEPDNPKGTLATEAQVEACRSFVTGSIVPYLTGKGFIAPVVGFSGNGFHIWLAFPPIVKKSQNWLKLRMQAFIDEVRDAHAAELKEKGLRIDHTSDLSRVFKLYGTRKAELHGARLSRIEGAGTRREDPKVRQYLLALDIKPYLSAETGEAAAVEIGDYAHTEVPAAFLALLSKDGRLKSTWEGERHDMQDNSRSGHDFSLAVQLARLARRDPKVSDLADPKNLAAILWNTPYGKVEQLAEKRGEREARRYLEHTIQRAIAAAEASTEPAGARESVADPVFEFPPFTYKADHFAVAGDRTVQATLTAFKDGKTVHRDRVCLSLAKKRAEFSNKCGAPAVDGHLIDIEQRLLAAWDKQAAARAEKSGKPTVEELSSEQKTAAMEFLNDPALMDRLDEDLSAAGLVGERVAGRLVYLTATSRMLARPLCVLITAGSAAGKSYVGDIVIKLIPEEQVIDATSFSPQSLAHAGSDLLKHKLVRIAENVQSEESETTAYYIRELLSRKKVERLTTVESEDGGFHTEKVTAEGPIAYVETTTKVKINDENQTRMFVLRIDESQEQTIRIQKAQRRARTIQGFSEDRCGEEVVARHHAAQSLLKPVAVVIPYADYIEFPSLKLRARRDHNRFLDLIEASACLHQHQRKQKVADGKTVIEAELQDYRIAREIAEYVLTDTMGDVPGASLKLYTALAQAAKAGQLDGETFTVRDACDVLGGSMSESVVRRYLKPLLYAELVLEVAESKGKYGAQYKLGKSIVEARRPLPSSGEVALKWLRASGVFPLKKRPMVLPGCASSPATENIGARKHG